MNKPKPADVLLLPANRDLLHHHLISKVRLNRYDTKFMLNIAEKYISKGLPLSPGQNDLYEKIVHKYRKQLRKLKVNYRDVLDLEWQHGLVSPEILNQQTYFRIAGNDADEPEMQLYFNFNKSQIEEVRALVHDDDGNHLNRGTTSEFGNFGNGQKYDFNWNNATKSWHGPMNLYLFKQLCGFVERSKIQVEDSVKNIVEKLEAYGTAEQWTPSIRIVNDRIYVSHLVESMLPYLDKLDATDTSVINIERFANLGLKIPDDYTYIGNYISGTTATKHEIKNDDDIKTLRIYLAKSNRKAIFHMPELSKLYSGRKRSEILDKLKKASDWPDTNISFLDAGKHTGDLLSTTLTSEELDNLVLAGYNTLVTTTPLTSLIRSQTEIGKFALEADKVIYISIKEPK